MEQKDRRLDSQSDNLGLCGKSKRLSSILCCSRHEINRDNYKDEIHLVNRSLIRKYLRYGLKSIFLTFNNLDKNLKTPGKLLWRHFRECSSFCFASHSILSRDITDLIIFIESERRRMNQITSDSDLSEMKRLTFSRHST